MEGFNAKVVDSFVTEDISKEIIDSIKKIDIWEESIEFWNKRIINIGSIKKYLPEQIFKYIEDISTGIKKYIEKEYSLNYEVYPDTITICRWFPGMEQPPHADDMSNTEVANLRHRLFGSIIYLNSDYSGGQTYYPNHNIEISPEVGKLIIHPGDINHLHGVKKIDNNIRYTIACFWTKEKSKAIDWSILK